MISIDFEKFTLSNGLDVILSQDRSLPVTAVNLWYHVGSKDEEAGKTGFAHLFEHVMFEGSKHHDQSYFEPLQKVGANLNGSTAADSTNYWENVPPTTSSSPSGWSPTGWDTCWKCSPTASSTSSATWSRTSGARTTRTVHTAWRRC